MRAWIVAVLTTLALTVATLATAAGTPAYASCPSCNGASSSPWGWTTWAQQTTGTSGSQGTNAASATSGNNTNDTTGASTAGGGQASTDPCTYAPVAGAPDLEAKSCPGDVTVGTSYAKLIQIGHTAGNPRTPAVPGRPRVTPEELALRAIQALTVPVLQVRTAPPRGSDGLVGLPEWFWIPAAQWTPLTRRATAGTVWAQVTARPATLTVNPGDGTGTISCDGGPGTAYNPGMPASSQQSDCAHTYQNSSAMAPGLAFPVTVSVTWTATWRGSGATGGTLPPLTRTVTIGLRVAEGQALVPGA